MDREPTELDKAIGELTRTFAVKLDQLAAGDFLREGVIRETMSSLVWDIFYQMPDQRDALADALENWPGLVREAAADERSKAGA